MPTEVVDALAGMSVGQAVSLAISLFSASLVPFFALIGADFDVRPTVRRVLVESGRLGSLLIVASAVKGAARDAVLDAAALLILLTTSPKGAMA